MPPLIPDHQKRLIDLTPAADDTIAMEMAKINRRITALAQMLHNTNLMLMTLSIQGQTRQ